MSLKNKLELLSSEENDIKRHDHIKSIIEKHLKKKIEGGSYSNEPFVSGGQTINHSHDFNLAPGQSLNVHNKNGHWMGTTDHRVGKMRGGISVSSSAKDYPAAIKKTLNYHAKAIKGLKGK
jgi:hypothetical protein